MNRNIEELKYISGLDRDLARAQAINIACSILEGYVKGYFEIDREIAAEIAGWLQAADGRPVPPEVANRPGRFDHYRAGQYRPAPSEAPL